MYIEWMNEKAGRINRLIPPVPERMRQVLCLYGKLTTLIIRLISGIDCVLLVRILGDQLIDSRYLKK